MSTRVTRFVMWVVMIVMVLLAVAVTALRVALPNLNTYKSDISQWVTANTGIEFEIQSVDGYWRNTHPSFSLKGVTANTAARANVHLYVEEVAVEFDLIKSFFLLSPQIAELQINQMALDISAIDFKKFGKDDEKQGEQQESRQFIERLDNLILRQLTHFSFDDSSLTYRSFTGDIQTLKLNNFKWENSGRQHLAEGLVTLADTSLNSMSVSANFTDTGALWDVGGEFYVQASNIDIYQWFPRTFDHEIGIEEGTISFNSWVTLEQGRPTNALVEILPSELTWKKEVRNDLFIEHGVIELKPLQNQFQAKEFQIDVHNLNIRTNDTRWPNLDVVFQSRPEGWILNVSELDVNALLPVATLIPQLQPTIQSIEPLAIKGNIEDIRVAKLSDNAAVQYSANVSNAAMQQWDLLPGVENASLSIAGTTNKASIQLSMIDNTLPYGDAFQAPLALKQGVVDIVWEQDAEGWSLWADKVTASTPDLQVLGAFKLDFPQDRSPFLSFYAEADLFNASQTWRYLPTLALGQSLTDYLSAAIQGGKVDTAKLLWYGELGNFPYAQHNGMFQAFVGLKQTKFSFDTSWPAITDLQLDLLFQNDAMYLDSRSAQLMGVSAKRITGRIPELGENGHIEIEAEVASAKGSDVRDYMTASPLVDSVGAALTAVSISGDVSSKFQLNIPFHEDRESRAWGYADLSGNHVDIDVPPTTLEKVTGRIVFDNDVVTSTGLKAELLGQAVNIDFAGEEQRKGYGVDINVAGDWVLEPLELYVGSKWLAPLSGHAPWTSAIDLQLNDVGFTYQVDVQADLNNIASLYPAPLTKANGEKASARLQVSGNQEAISSRLQLPGVKYQAEINLTQDVPIIEATNLIVGKGAFKVSPVVGNNALVRIKQFDADEWFSFYSREEDGEVGKVSSMNVPDIPLPSRVQMQVGELSLAGMDWHDVDFNARKKSRDWLLTLNSAEAVGKANYLEPYDLNIAMERLHIYTPQLEALLKEEEGDNIPANMPKTPLISELDRTIYQWAPNLTLHVDDFWLQGYKVGVANIEVLRKEERLEWQNVSFTSGDNEVKLGGQWTLSDSESQTELSLSVKSKNNSELMERFGISSGIQKSPFEMKGQFNWHGAPWSMKVDSLAGDVSTKFGKGVISDVSGAARLLGIFSLDSILRKMQLDFTDVFDKGMAFNSISGSGELRDGVFVTNNLNMDAVSGEMNIRGLADLNTRQVDAEVDFTPDMTSGIPVLTAFAVTPQTALYVLAITTVISPVVEVFTEVNYSIKGPIDSPKVTELSRSQGDYSLPKEFQEHAREQLK